MPIFIGNSNDETNFLYELLWTDTQVLKIRKALANGSSANIKFSKIQLFNLNTVKTSYWQITSRFNVCSWKQEELVKGSPELTKDATRYFVNKGINILKKCFQLNENSRITLTNIKIKYNIKLIQFLENKGILLKVTTIKITS